MNSTDQIRFLDGATFHHIGFVVEAIEPIAQRFALTVGSRWSGQVFEDPIQNVKVSFFDPLSPSAPMIELVAPAGDRSPVSRFLSRGGGLHHLAYEVDDITESINKSRSIGMVLISRPQPAIAFGNRRIAWIYSKDRLLVELIEK